MFIIEAFASGGKKGSGSSAGQGRGSSQTGAQRRGNQTVAQNTRANNFVSAFGNVSSVNGIPVRGRGSSNASRAAAANSIYSRGNSAANILAGIRRNTR